MKGAIADLQHQKQQRKIENLVGYLYEAIVCGWNLPDAHTSCVFWIPVCDRSVSSRWSGSTLEQR
ncbi:hypothetical protein NDI52_29590 [Leptolyngbya sp. PL-A3]|uniref:hypothetical protein n=1 Tax=Leptolyngbya sp. PL-A3 TaxID=2933911 RepID=UPI00329821AA